MKVIFVKWIELVSPGCSGSETNQERILMVTFQKCCWKNKFGQLIDASFRPIFSTKFEERRTDQQKYLPIEMQLYISVMFLGLPDDIH